MKIPLSWLDEYVKIDDIPPAELAEKLTRAGLQVEGIETVGDEPLSDFFVVVEVLECEPHPDSDHLHVCKVTDGSEEYQVVCGAPNMRKGIRTAFAKIGAVVPEGGFKIKRAKLRGVKSTTGEPIFKQDFQGTTQYSLDGMRMEFPMNGAFDLTAAQMIVGDWNQLVYAIRQDITFKVFTEGVVQDPSDGSIVYNLMQNDMVALRAVMRLGWEIPNPINAFNASNSTRCPFSVYLPANPQ